MKQMVIRTCSDFNYDNLTYLNENLSPFEALRQELEFWSEAPR